MREYCGENRLIDWLASKENMVDAWIQVTLLDPETGGCIALRIKIYEEDVLLGKLQCCSKVDRRRCLADSTLLIDYGNRSCSPIHKCFTTNIAKLMLGVRFT